MIARLSSDGARSLNAVKASAGERVATSSPSSQVLTMPTSLSYSSMVSLADLSSRSSSTLPRGMHVTNNSGGDMQTVPFPSCVLLPAPLRSWARQHLALRSALVSGLKLAVCSGGSRGFLDIVLWSRHEGN